MNRVSLTFLLLVSMPLVASADVTISEIAWMGTSESANNEWIELHNTGSQDIDVSNWVLEAADGTPSIILSGIVLANEYFLLERTDDTSVPAVSAEHIYTGALGNGGEVLTLRDIAGTAIDTVNAGSGWLAGDNDTKETMQRVSGGWVTALATPKAQNNQADPSQHQNDQNNDEEKDPNSENTQDGQDGEAQNDEEESHDETQEEEPAAVWNIVISEIMYDVEGSDSKLEWIEVYNKDTEVADIRTWYFVESDTRHRLVHISGEETIDMEEYAIIADDAEAFEDEFPEFSGTLFDSSFSLSNDGETISLQNSDKIVIDDVTYTSEWGASGDGHSLQQIGNVWSMGIPTPWQENTHERFVEEADEVSEVTQEETSPHEYVEVVQEETSHSVAESVQERGIVDTSIQVPVSLEVEDDSTVDSQVLGESTTSTSSLHEVQSSVVNTEEDSSMGMWLLGVGVLILLGVVSVLGFRKTPKTEEDEYKKEIQNIVARMHIEE